MKEIVEAVVWATVILAGVLAFEVALRRRVDKPKKEKVHKMPVLPPEDIESEVCRRAISSGKVVSANVRSDGSVEYVEHPD